jgi:hypothetical protein
VQQLTEIRLGECTLTAQTRTVCNSFLEGWDTLPPLGFGGVARGVDGRGVTLIGRPSHARCSICIPCSYTQQSRTTQLQTRLPGARGTASPMRYAYTPLSPHCCRYAAASKQPKDTIFVNKAISPSDKHVLVSMLTPASVLLPPLQTLLVSTQP